MNNKIEFNGRTLEARQIVKHFKREIHMNGTDYLYKIIGTAKHTETGETMVIYMPLYDVPSMANVSFAARPIDMVMSEVDHEKYPDIQQKYRFEPITPADIMEFEEINDEFYSMTTVFFKIPKEILANIFKKAGEVPKDDSLRQNDEYIGGEIQYNFDKNDGIVDPKAFEVLVVPMYNYEDGGEVAGEFINPPDEYCTKEMLQYAYRFIELDKLINQE